MKAKIILLLTLIFSISLLGCTTTDRFGNEVLVGGGYALVTYDSMCTEVIGVNSHYVHVVYNPSYCVIDSNNEAYEVVEYKEYLKVVK